MDTETHRVRNTPPGTTVYLLKDWCTQREETYLLGRVYASPKWTNVSARRLQSFGGQVREKGTLAEKMPDWLASEIGKVQHTVGELMPTRINHVLVNEYLPGNGILPHQDGGCYHPCVLILSLGCDAVMRFAPHKDFRDDSSYKEFGIFLPCRSLLLFHGTTYTEYLHGIEAVDVDVIDGSVVNFGDVSGAASDEMEETGIEKRDALKKEKNGDDDSETRSVTLRRDTTRVSMTFRNVLRVRKALRMV